MLSILKTLSFFLIAEALTGLIYHRPVDENSSFSSEKPSTKELTAWLLSELHVLRQLKYKLKMIIHTEPLRASNCKHCKTAVLAEKSSLFFWLATLVF